MINNILFFSMTSDSSWIKKMKQLNSRNEACECKPHQLPTGLWKIYRNRMKTPLIVVILQIWALFRDIPLTIFQAPFQGLCKR